MHFFISQEGTAKRVAEAVELAGAHMADISTAVGPLGYDDRGLCKKVDEVSDALYEVDRTLDKLRTVSVVVEGLVSSDDEAATLVEAVESLTRVVKELCAAIEARKN